MLLAKTRVLVLSELGSFVSLCPGADAAGKVNCEDHCDKNHSAVDSEVHSSRLVRTPVRVKFQYWYDKNVDLH